MQSWYEQHRQRWDDLDADVARVLEAYRLEGPGLEPAFRPYQAGELGHAAPSVRFLCPRGHLIDDVGVERSWDGVSERERWTVHVRRTRRYREEIDSVRGLHVQAPWMDAPTVQSESIGLRNRARCRNPKCRYDGRVKLEDLLKLYVAAVQTGTRDVRLKD